MFWALTSLKKNSKTLDEYDNDTHVCLSEKISSLLYADDLVLFSSTPEGLQNKLDHLHKYCKEWCLKVNINKSKVIVFNKTGRVINHNFKIDPENLECVNKYKYLGVILSALEHLKRRELLCLIKQWKHLLNYIKM